jgi:hypothetical protein
VRPARAHRPGNAAPREFRLTGFTGSRLVGGREAYVAQIDSVSDFGRAACGMRRERCADTGQHDHFVPGSFFVRVGWSARHRYVRGQRRCFGSLPVRFGKRDDGREWGKRLVDRGISVPPDRHVELRYHRAHPDVAWRRHDLSRRNPASLRFGNWRRLRARGPGNLLVRESLGIPGEAERRLRYTRTVRLAPGNEPTDPG